MVFSPDKYTPYSWILFRRTFFRVQISGQKCVQSCNSEITSIPDGHFYKTPPPLSPLQVPPHCAPSVWEPSKSRLNREKIMYIHTRTCTALGQTCVNVLIITERFIFHSIGSSRKSFLIQIWIRLDRLQANDHCVEIYFVYFSRVWQYGA